MEKSKIIRIICLCLAICIVIGLCGCNDSGNPQKDNSSTADTSSAPQDSNSDDYYSDDTDMSDDQDYDDTFDDEDYGSDDYYTADDDWSDEEYFDDGTLSDDEDYDDDTLEEDEYYDQDENFEDDVVYDEITVNNTKTVHTDYMGLNGIYQGYTYMPDFQGRTYTEKMAQLEFDRIAQMGVSMVRTYYGTKYAWDTNTSSWNWESDHMKALYKWAGELEKRDIEVAINACWQVEAVIDGSGWDTANGVYTQGDFAKTCEKYGKFMVDTVNQFKAHGVNNIKYLMLFTEPGYAYEGEDGNPNFSGATVEEKISDLEAPVFDRWLSLVKALDSAFKNEGIRKDYLFVGPNESSWTYSVASGTYYRPMFYQAVTQANDYIDIFSGHLYIETNDQSDDVTNDFCDTYYAERAALVKEKTGKRFWIDEFNMRDTSVNSNLGGTAETVSNMFHSLHIATAVSSGMRLGINNMMLWLLADQLWPDSNEYSNEFLDGVQVNGTLPSLFQTSVPRSTYYGVSLLTKYLGHNADVYETVSGFTSTGFQQDENGDYTLLAVNFSFTESTNLTVNFEKSLGTTTLYRYVYNPVTQKVTQDAKLISPDKAIKFDGTCFTDTIDPLCVVIYTTRKV